MVELWSRTDSQLWAAADPPYTDDLEARAGATISPTPRTISLLMGPTLLPPPLPPPPESLPSPSSPSPTSEPLPTISAPITSSPRAAKKLPMSSTRAAYRTRTIAAGSPSRSSPNWPGLIPSSSLYFSTSLFLFSFPHSFLHFPNS